MLLGARRDEAFAHQTIVHRLRHKMSARRVRVHADGVRSNLYFLSADRTRHARAQRPNGAVRCLARIDSLMFAGDDKLPVVGVIQIHVILGQEPMAAGAKAGRGLGS